MNETIEKEMQTFPKIRGGPTTEDDGRFYYPFFNAIEVALQKIVVIQRWFLLSCFLRYGRGPPEHRGYTKPPFSIRFITLRTWKGYTYVQQKNLQM